MLRVATLAMAVLALAPLARSQSGTAATSTPVPFRVGERLEYEIRYGPFRGSADMEVTSLDTIRGRPAWHAEFSVRGGIPFFRINDHYEVNSDFMAIVVVGPATVGALIGAIGGGFIARHSLSDRS